jgi:CDP-glucose 4,6-dehydratase
VRDEAAVRDAMARARPEVVFHLAAQAIVRAALERPAETFAVNVMGTAHVLGAARDAAVVCVTSDKCYAPGPGPHREGDPLGGRDPYSSSKAAQELVAAAYRESRGVRVATARAGNVIGGGDWGRDRLLPDLARARQSGEPVVLRHPDALRPWQHVLDPLAGYLKLAERLHASAEWAAAWNFGPEESRSVRWVVDRVRERWPLDVRVADPGDGVEAPELRLDARAARDRLQWRPQLDAETALAATVSWYDEVRAGRDARTVTLAQIEERT